MTSITEAEIRQPGRTPRGELWRRIRQNQDERYHKLDASPYRIAPWFGILPDFYIDFKKTFALPTEQVYSALGAGYIRRVATVPHTYIHHLMQRFFGFLSRVGVPG